MVNVVNINKKWRLILITVIVAAAVMCLNASDVNAGSWHEKYLSPGQTYDVSDAGWNTTVYINKAGNYTLKGQSEKCKVVVQSGGVNIYLENGLRIDPDIKANIGVATASLIIEDMDGTVKLISKKNANAYFGGYLMAPAIEKVGYNSKLLFETEDPSTPGTITAYRAHSSNSAGIGSAYRLSVPVTTGNIEINSGNIIATGGYTSAGIGGGGTGSAHKIVINDGNVKAVGGSHGTGIGGGYHGNASNITINGGTVEAISIGEGAGIGSGEQSKYAKNIIINGGNIRAISDLGAGIGGGDRSEVENLRLNGGNIYAYSRDTAIGSSSDQHQGILKSLYITGGTIRAESKTTAIGAAADSPGPNNIYISGGTIEAKGEQIAIGGGGFSSVTDDTRITNVTVSGGTITADGGDEDFGGGKWLNEFNLTIAGGSILAERNKMDSAPEDQFGNKVYRTDITIDGLSQVRYGVQDTGIAGIPAAYGVNDVYTTRDSKLYFWIPDNAVVNMATLPGGNVYRGKVAAGKSGTLYKDTLVYIESDDSRLAAGSGTLYEGTDVINNLATPEISVGHKLTGYKVRGTDTLVADKDGKLVPNVTVGGVAYTDTDGKWIRNTSAMINFKAVAEESSYTIVFDSNVPESTKSIPYPDGDMADVTVRYTQDYNIPTADFSLKGYTFTGWNTKPDGSGNQYAADTAVNSLAESGTVTLYAQWIPKKYTVTFKESNADGAVTCTQEMQYDQYASLTAFETTGFDVPENMKFVGWKRTGALGGTIYHDGASVVNLCNAGNDGSISGYTLAPSFINVNQPVVMITLDGESWTELDVVLKTGDTQIVEFQNVNGVYVAESGSDGVMSGEYDILVNEQDTKRNITIGENCSNYAHLEYYSVDVICDDKLENAAVTSSEVLEGTSVKINVEDPDADDGYIFERWKAVVGSPKPLEGSVTDCEVMLQILGKTEMKAVSRPVEYTVKFDGNKPQGASGEMSGTMEQQDFVYDEVQKLSGNEYALTGYTFTGWNTASDGSGQAFSDREAVKNLTSEDKEIVILYAQWEAVSYSVIFHKNSAGSSEVNNIDCIYDEEFELPECGSNKKDYHFLGWCSAIDGIGAYYYPGDEVKNLASENGATVVLYAIWEHDFYTVKYDGGSSVGQVPDMQVWTGEEMILSNPGFRKEGYQLTGWNTEADGTGNPYAVDEKVTDLTEKNGTVTLYAQWAPQTYVVTFDANGGKGTMKPQEMIYDEAQKLEANIFEAPAGKEFSGWMADDGNDQTEDVMYENQEEVMNLCQYNDEGQLIGLVMIAQWKDIEKESADSDEPVNPDKPGGQQEPSESNEASDTGEPDGSSEKTSKTGDAFSLDIVITVLILASAAMAAAAFRRRKA